MSFPAQDRGQKKLALPSTAQKDCALLSVLCLKQKRMTNSQAKTLSKKDILFGAKASFSNANSLFKSAKLIAANNNYGTANSLLILSVEECIKCMILTSVYLGRKLDFDIYPFFSRHGHKHKEAGKIQLLVNNFSYFAPVIHDI